MKYHISQFYRFCRYHSRADALTPAIVLALCSFKLFQICAILFEVNSGCPGTGWQIIGIINHFSLHLFASLPNADGLDEVQDENKFKTMVNSTLGMIPLQKNNT